MSAALDDVLRATRYGASTEDWAAAATFLPDVLPVVCHPSPIRLKVDANRNFAKEPSRYYSGIAQGISSWPTYVATATELDAWSRQIDYGISVVARRVRAFDIDINTPEVVARIVAGLIERTGFKSWPVRWRANSAHVLLPFVMPADAVGGDLRKRKVITSDGGAVEILGTGQQFIAAGTHRSGARYQWSRSYPPDGLEDPTIPRFDELPELTREEFEALAVWLADEFGENGAAGALPTQTATRSAVRAELARDPLSAALHDAGLVRGTRSDGGVNVLCPWRDEHSGDSGPSESTYWPPHTGGFAGGAYKCQHAHCESRTVRDLREFLALDGRHGDAAEFAQMSGGASASNVPDAVAEEIAAAAPDVLFLPNDYLPATAAAERLFRSLGDARELYYRAGSVVELGERGELQVVSPSALRSRINRRGRKSRAFKAQAHGGPPHSSAKMCSDDAARLLLATLEAGENLPRISLVTSSPLLIEEAGQLVTCEPGYTAAGGGVLVRCDALEIEIMAPERAAELLSELLADFDFTADGDRSRALASLIAPAIRMGDLLPGANALVTAVEADKSQAGKGYFLELVRALYGETAYMVAPRVGGVGSTDESLGQALLSGRPFIAVDNARGKVNSMFWESVLTARDNPVSVRVPHRGEIPVRVDRVLFQLTSNGIETTEDLANRLLLIRIRKRPAGYPFRYFPEGDLLAHLAAHRGRYLGAVHSIVRRWWAAQRPRNAVEHTFRDWCGALDWIARECFGSVPLLDGHAVAVGRVANPALSWLRVVGEAVLDAGRVGDAFSASELVAFAGEAGHPPPWGGQSTLADLQSARRLGMALSPFFSDGERLTIDRMIVERGERRDKDMGNDTTRAVRVYSFHRVESV
jgi:hypothetical protein